MRRASSTGTKFDGGGKKLETESEGGQKFLPPNPLPFCPPERLDFRIKNSDFRQKMFEHQSKNTAKIENRNRKPKWGRHEVPTQMYSPHKILNLKGFATLRVAQKVRFENLRIHTKLKMPPAQFSQRQTLTTNYQHAIL